MMTIPLREMNMSRLAAREIINVILLQSNHSQDSQLRGIDHGMLEILIRKIKSSGLAAEKDRPWKSWLLERSKLSSCLLPLLCLLHRRGGGGQHHLHHPRHHQHRPNDHPDQTQPVPLLPCTANKENSDFFQIKLNQFELICNTGASYENPVHNCSRA